MSLTSDTIHRPAAERERGEVVLREDLRIAAASGDRDAFRLATGVLADLLDDQGRWLDAESVRRDYLASFEQAPPRPSLWPSVLQLDGVSEHQREQLGRALTKPLAALVGGPGTGKTHCVASILKGLTNVRRSRLRVAAPTGKAAVRCAESLRRASISLPFAPSTIHQLLGIGRNGRDGGGWAFLHDEEHPLTGVEYLVVDEASMLDSPLSSSLLSACPTGTHVLLVGDPDQLPPVGHGAPLRDLIGAGLPLGRLAEVRRNAGRIVRGCHAIRDGITPEPCARLDRDAGDNWRHVEVPPNQSTQAVLVKTIAALAELGYSRPEDVQVICAVNKRSDVAADVLNTLLQASLNPMFGKGGATNHKIGPGDTVICRSNGWYVTAQAGAQAEYVANGETGFVVGADSKSVAVDFPGGRRVRYVHGAEGLALGHAITGHRSQGSEWPAVVIMVDESPSAARVVGRNWWYTVLSRASQVCITIGRLAALQQQCLRPSLGRRKTFLRDCISKREWTRR